MAYTDHPNGAFLTRRGNYNVFAKILDQEITLSRYFDTSVDNLAATLFYKIFSVPANFVITDAFISCVTAEGAAETIDLVDDDLATTVIISNANINSAGGVTATTARKVYTSAGFIVLRPDHALTAAKFYVTVKGYILNTSM